MKGIIQGITLEVGDLLLIESESMKVKGIFKVLLILIEVLD
ncbi:MAG: hypothetical protein ACXAC8_14600 [Candidatus Hodarchaeales archaeon]